MSCKINSHKTFFGILLSVFAPVFLSFFFFVTDSYALNDLTTTVDLSTSTSGYVTVFPDCDYTCLTSYSFLKIELFQVSSSSVAVRFAPGGGTSSFSFSPNLPFIIVSVPSSLTAGYFVSYYNYMNSPGSTLVFTYFSSLSDCPEPEEPEPCPEIPENPYDPKLEEITRAIYVTAGTLIVLYFFYCIYRLIIKNSGVH